MEPQDPYRWLFEASKLLLGRAGDEGTAQTLLERVVDATGSSRGLLVVRDQNGSFSQSFEVGQDRARSSAAERRFSRSLVREVIEKGHPIESQDLLADPRFTGVESVLEMGPRAVLAVPLRAEEQVYGVLYLERPGALAGGGFAGPARQLACELAEAAGLFLREATERRALRERARSLETDLFASHSFPGIVTRDPRMLELLRVVAQVAGSDATVLVLGESGTGKELVARALHLNGARASRPFVALHCAALPASVLEDELFGHVAGAFTGAQRDRAGRIASASGGTLLLDELAEIPLEVQAKLLRFLESGEIQRLGSDRVERVEVRVVGATHADLGALVRAGKFRQDLYFRLKVLELRLPPLRERPGDLPLLLRHFLGKHWRGAGAAARFSERAERRLRVYAWPGNVRELEHAVERACLLASGPVLDLELLPEELNPDAAPEAVVAAGAAGADAFAELTNAALLAAKESAAAALEREFLERLLASAGGNVSRAARAAGMRRSWLQQLMARHGMQAARRGS